MRVSPGEFYQLESNETTSFDIDKTFPDDISLTVYSHCLLPGSSELKNNNEHADIFLGDTDGKFSGLWVLGIHSLFHAGSAVCSPATPLEIVKPQGRFVVFTSSGSHYEIGFTATSKKYQNIARADFPQIVDKIYGDVYLINNNLFNARKIEVNADKLNKILAISFKRKIIPAQLSLNYRATGKVHLQILSNGKVLKNIEIEPSAVTTYIKLENIKETKLITFKARSHGTPSQLFMRPILIWEKK